MNNKEMIKIIKEIAECNKDSCNNCKSICDYYSAITLFCEKVLPEGLVVLSKEEYEKIKSLYDCGNGYMTSQIGDLPLTVEGLRKAVDEITRLNRVEAELQELNAKYYNEAKDLRRELKQARKETAKEFVNLSDSDILLVDTQEYGEIEVVSVERLREIAKQYGVEVEE